MQLLLVVIPDTPPAIGLIHHASMQLLLVVIPDILPAMGLIHRASMQLLLVVIPDTLPAIGLIHHCGRGPGFITVSFHLEPAVHSMATALP